MTTAAPGVLAPVAAREFGLPVSQVGVMIVLHYFATVPSGLASAALQARYGAVRVLQMSAIGVAVAILSCALAGFVAIGTDFPVTAGWLFALWLLATGVIYGTGYGLINPVSANVLFHATPVKLRSAAFSIKQTAVPVGFGLAGLFIPLLLTQMRWQWVAVILACILVAAALAMFAARLYVPGVGASGGSLLRWNDFIGPVRDILHDPMMRRRGMMAVAYSGTQTAITAYLVTFLNVEIGMTLVAAGSVMAMAQVGGVTSRILLGVSADLWMKPRIQLAIAGIATAVCCIAMVAITPQWPYAAITALCVLFGTLSFAWNGVFHAETASIAAPGQIGRVTGGMQVFVSAGAMGGPALVSLILALTSSFGVAFVVLALPTLVVGVMFLSPAREGAAVGEAR